MMRTMRWLRAMGKRLRGGARAREEFEAELESHIAMHVDDAMRRGLTQEQARREALIALGGAEQTRQAVRERTILPWLDGLGRDVQFAVRQMVRAPGFTLTAVLTLALGIGANTVIYTLVDSILLRPLPYAQQDRLIRITGATAPGFPKGWLRALGEHAHMLKAIAGYGPDAESNVSDGGAPERVFGSAVTANALDTLGIRPELGDFFTAQDAVAGQDHSVVLSYGYWRQRYGGSPTVLGKTVRIDGVSRRVVGVMPAGVRFPYADTQFVIPVAFRADDAFDPWVPFDLHAFGRMADGATTLQAQAELHALHGSLLGTFPWKMPDVWASDMTVTPLLEAETGALRPRLLLLFGAVGLILLIACANVANLMLARTNARERELAIRGALGASGSRIVRQLLSESVVLGVAAGVVGLAAAYASLHVFAGLLPADTPRIGEVALRAKDVAFTLGASVLAGLLFGVIPAVRMASMSLLMTLRAGGRGITGRGVGAGVSMALVMAQIALSVVVVASAGLMLHSLYALIRVDPGFRTANTVTAEVALDAAACKDKARCAAFFRTLEEQLQGAPAVESAALADALPLSGRDNSYVYDAEGHPRDARQGALVATGRVVSSEYRAVLGLELVRGRWLEPQDTVGTARAVVINERMARRLWPGADAVGRHVLDVNDAPAPAVWDGAKAAEIVGVVRATRAAGLDAELQDEVYLPMTPARAQPVMYVLLRSHGTAAQAAATLRRTVADLDAEAAVTHVRTMDEVVAGSIAAPRALATLLLGFGLLALVIGAVGVYSLIAYMVSGRTREIGLRLALGAQRWQIVLGVVRQSLLLAAGGCAAGLLGTAALGRVLRRFLFEVSALDPATLGGVAVLMLAVALVAAWAPARRAAAVDPMVALRSE